jgi:hypothetical protein
MAVRASGTVNFIADLGSKRSGLGKLSRLESMCPESVSIGDLFQLIIQSPVVVSRAKAADCVVTPIRGKMDRDRATVVSIFEPNEADFGVQISARLG